LNVRLGVVTSDAQENEEPVSDLAHDTLAHANARRGDSLNDGSHLHARVTTDRDTEALRKP
jgi:hypothetical protein